MNSVERVKKICKERKIPISRLEKELGFANGYIGQLRKGSFPFDRLVKIADYLNLKIEDLMDVEVKEWQPTITDKDEKDIKKTLDALKSQLSTGTGLMYDGEPMNEEDMEYVLQAVEALERNAMLAAKKKFTPKKYQK